MEALSFIQREYREKVQSPERGLIIYVPSMRRHRILLSLWVRIQIYSLFTVIVMDLAALSTFRMSS